MRFAALYLCLVVFTFCLVVPCGCEKKAAEMASNGPDRTQNERKKADKASAKKETQKNVATTKKGDASKAGTKKKSEEPSVLAEVPEKTVEQIMGYYTKKFTLSAEQEKEADEIIMAHGIEFRDLRRKSAEILTKEMRDARAEAVKKALDGGAAKADAAKAGDATIDEATRLKLDEVDKEENELIKKTRLEVRKILTEEQREMLKEAGKSNKDDAEKADGDKAEDKAEGDKNQAAKDEPK